MSFARESYCSPVLEMRKVCAYVAAVMAIWLSACGSPEPDLTCDLPPAPECRAPAAFVGAPDGARVEQHSRPRDADAASVELGPDDAGRLLRIYPTTENDVWSDGGSISFLDSTGNVICSTDPLCVSAFYDGSWVIPDGATTISVILPTSVITTVLFTVVID